MYGPECLEWRCTWMGGRLWRAETETEIETVRLELRRLPPPISPPHE